MRMQAWQSEQKESKVPELSSFVWIPRGSNRAAGSNTGLSGKGGALHERSSHWSSMQVLLWIFQGRPMVRIKSGCPESTEIRWDVRRASLQLAQVKVFKASEEVCSRKRDAILSFKDWGGFCGQLVLACLHIVLIHLRLIRLRTQIPRWIPSCFLLLFFLRLLKPFFFMFSSVFVISFSYALQ